MSIYSSFLSFVKFQLIPLPAVGIFFSILGYLQYQNWIDLNYDIFSLLYNPLFIIMLGIASFLYIDRFYMQKFSCTCHSGWKKKIHYLSGYITGIKAALVFYLIPVVTLFFIIYDSESETAILAQNIELFAFEIPLIVGLAIFGFIARVITREVFASLGENSGVLFNPKKTVVQQTQEFYEKVHCLFLRLIKKYTLNY